MTRLIWEDFAHIEKRKQEERDNFTIEFAKWISYKYKYLDNKGWFATTYQLEMGIFLSSKELLEQFKKQQDEKQVSRETPLL